MPELLLVLSPAEIEQLAQLLFKHVEPGQLRSLARSRLNIDLDVIADGKHGHDVAAALIEEAHRQHNIARLLELAMIDFPPAEPLQNWIAALCAAGGQVSANSSLHKLLCFQSPTQDFYVFCELAREKGRHVCRVEIDEVPVGTGLLVGPDSVLTAHHVVQELIKNGQPDANSAKRLVFRFDYFRSQNKTVSNGVKVTAATLWLGPHLPAHPNDGMTLNPAEPPYFREHLDYALISLSRHIGDEPLRPEGGETRGWTEIDDDEALVPLVSNLPIFIGHHPGGIPLQSTIGTVDTCNRCKTRVRYNANVTKGSSGAPCFNNDFRVVAMHHAGIQGFTLNQGIPIVHIKKHILTYGRQLEASGDRFFPVWKLADGSPVIGRDEFQRAVWESKSSVSGKAILTVVGSTGMGKTHCIEVLRMQLGGTNRVIAYDFENLYSKGLKALLTQLCQDLAISMDGMPEIPEDRQPARWANIDLPNWFAEALQAKFFHGNADQNTVWIAIDNFEKHEFFDEEARDFFISLLQSTARLKQLRWLLLGKLLDSTLVNPRSVESIVLLPLTQKQAHAYFLRYCAGEGKSVMSEKITYLVDFIFKEAADESDQGRQLGRQVRSIMGLQLMLPEKPQNV